MEHGGKNRKESGGQSRAAKRRQKKKQKLQHPPTDAKEAQDSKAKEDKHISLPGSVDPSIKHVEHCQTTSEMVADSRAKKARQEGAGPKIFGSAFDSTGEGKILELKNIWKCAGVQGGKTTADKIILDDELPSDEKALKILDYLIAPVTHKTFFEDYWEEAPFVVLRQSEDYLAGWFSSKDLRQATKQQSLLAGKDIELMRAAPGSGKQQAFFLDRGDAARGAPARAAEIWEKFREGWSASYRCPAKWGDPAWRLAGALEEAFGTRVGCWATLSPPAAAAAAARPPHAHDYHSLVLQLEGQRKWHVYPPQDPPEEAAPAAAAAAVDEGHPEQEEGGAAAGGDEEGGARSPWGELPRAPLDRVEEALLPNPVLEVTLNPGDTLYLPPGYIHKARTAGDAPSLHLSLSCGHENSYADFLEMVVPEALQALVAENADVRRSLPRDYLNYTGIMYSDKQSKAREDFQATIRRYLEMIIDRAEGMADAAADQFAKRFISDKLPPVLTEAEEERTSDKTKLEPMAWVRLARRSAARLAVEGGTAVLYHAGANAREHHGAPLAPLEFAPDDAPAIEAILGAYPDAVRIKDLPHPPTEDLEDKMGIVEALFNEGILLVYASNELGPGSGGEEDSTKEDSISSPEDRPPPLDEVPSSDHDTGPSSDDEN